MSKNSRHFRIGLVTKSVTFIRQGTRYFLGYVVSPSINSSFKRVVFILFYIIFSHSCRKVSLLTFLFFCGGCMKCGSISF